MFIFTNNLIIYFLTDVPVLNTNHASHSLIQMEIDRLTLFSRTYAESKTANILV